MGPPGGDGKPCDRRILRLIPAGGPGLLHARAERVNVSAPFQPSPSMSFGIAIQGLPGRGHGASVDGWNDRLLHHGGRRSRPFGTPPLHLDLDPPEQKRNDCRNRH